MSLFRSTLSRAGALALCAFAGLSLAATFARDTTTAVDVGVTEYEWKVMPGTVPVGTVVFNVHNDGDFVHDFSIIGHTTRPLKSRESATLTVVFPRPGQYTYNSTWDDVDREMWGIFTVTGTPLTTTATPPTTTATTTTQSSPTLPLRRVADVPLPGGSSRFDYQSLDPKKKRLYIAHLGADAVVVFDARRRRVARNVTGIAGPHGVLAVPELGRVYAAATDTHQLVAIRDTTLAVVARTTAGTFPDGLAYEPVRKRVFVSDKDGDAAVVVDRSGHVVRRVPLGGEAGNVKYDAGAKRMLVAVAGREQLASIHPVKLRVVARAPLPGCTGAHGLQLDAARRLAFVACEKNARLVVVDLRTHRATQTLTVGDGPDVLALDPSLHRLYVAAESGVVAVFAEQGRRLVKLGQALLAPSAHSVAVDPSTHLVYFPLENVNGRPVLRIMAPVRSASRSR
jgi:DNA-binding beta-propeller fold protein YncE